MMQRTSKTMAFGFGVILLVALALPHAAHAGFKFVPNNGNAAGYGAPVAPAASPVVEGFADRVPLPVALRQILPRGTVYNIADDVDMGVQVSWTGGRAWQQVLNDMLGAVGLQGQINGNTVTVRRAAYLNGNITGTSEPIQLMPPVRLTPPLQPVVIEDSAPVLREPPPAYTPPAYAPAPVVQTPAPVAQAPAQEVTSLNIDSAPMAAVAPSPSMMPAGAPAAPPGTAGTIEVTSHDPEFKTGQQLASGPGYLTPPAGMVADGDTVNLPADSVGSSTLMPLDGSTPAMPETVVDPNLWEARSGQSLRDVLTVWAERAGVEMNWQSEYDYPVQASLTFTGDFDQAVRTLLYGFKDASPQPIGRLHRNAEAGQQTLLIATRGNIYEE